ncbi:serine/threonine protein kinase [Hamadaea flava]|uniref:non-specific serine/threonine protein kinase n=1 Tax=Hamadaea flava TaxID=1742688 RepID=A0ABV8LY01_9ACTN|nr:serine/threonine-protein kinase [Hamadaea flava]MCP2321600.1 serine/threonine protein kinase [Hamadaea flava]
MTTAGEPVPNRPGPQVPGYRELTEVARSAGSVVYRAYQEALNRPVALKALQLTDPAALARFEREVELTVRLGRRHPHIVQVLGTAVTSDGRPCIVMEFYDAGSLHDQLHARGPLPIGTVLEAGAVVADALAFAHSQGVLHRDVKPQNILVLPTSYVVADFGIARPIDAAPHTQSLDWFTVQHASPQVLEGRTPTVADDVWALGSTLFTLLDGEPPHTGDDNTFLAYVRRVREEPPRPLTRPDVPADLRAVIDRCLSPAAEDRYATALEIRDQLRRIASSERTSAHTPASATPAALASLAEPAMGGAAPPEAVTVRQPVRDMSPTSLGRLVAAAAAAATPAAPPTAATPAAGPFGAGSRISVESWAEIRPGTVIRRARIRVARAVGRRATVAAATGTVLVGVALGVTSLWLTLIVPVSQPTTPLTTQPTTQPSTRPKTQPSTQPTKSTTITPTPTVSRQPSPSRNLNKPEIAPSIIDIRRTGGSVVVTWFDATDGEATFLVVRVQDGQRQPLVTAPAGATEATVYARGIGQQCFLVIAMVGLDRGVSVTRCTE